MVLVGQERLNGPGQSLPHTSVYYYLIKAGGFPPINALASHWFVHPLIIYTLPTSKERFQLAYNKRHVLRPKQQKC